jgi:thymidylate kinase
MLSFLRSTTAEARRPTLVYVEGNIGAGKSATMSAIKNCLQKDNHTTMLIPENTERWNFEHLLQDLSNCPDNRAAKRAFDALGPLRDHIERARFIEKCGAEYNFIILERHPTTTLDVFGADKAVRSLYETIETIYSFMELPQMTVYVKASPYTCVRRVEGRDRAFERSIDMAVVKDLDAKHGVAMLARQQAGGHVLWADSDRSTPEQIAAVVCAELKALF